MRLEFHTHPASAPVTKFFVCRGWGTTIPRLGANIAFRAMCDETGTPKEVQGEVIDVQEDGEVANLWLDMGEATTSLQDRSVRVNGWPGVSYPAKG